ncbi:uncharacterized protein LOC100371560 [Saccoglossus kowalevskii]
MHLCIVIIRFMAVIFVALTVVEANPIHRPSMLSEWLRTLKDENDRDTNIGYREITAFKRNPTSGHSIGLSLDIIRDRLEKAESERMQQEKQSDINRYRQNTELMTGLGRRRRSMEEVYRQ